MGNDVSNQGDAANDDGWGGSASEGMGPERVVNFGEHVLSVARFVRLLHAAVPRTVIFLVPFVCGTHLPPNIFHPCAGIRSIPRA